MVLVLLLGMLNTFTVCLLVTRNPQGTFSAGLEFFPPEALLYERFEQICESKQKNSPSFLLVLKNIFQLLLQPFDRDRLH